MPTISIIVPVYKAAKYIVRCIESILSQTYQDVELILVDDGSPDHSGSICDLYARKDQRIHVIHQINQGVSAARNAGIEAASGDYLMFVDSDDVVHSQCAERLLASVKETGAQIAIGDIARFERDGMPDLVSPVPEACSSVITNLEALQMLLDTTAFTSRFTSPCCKLYAKKLFDHVRFPAGRRFEDEFVAYQLYFLAEKCVLCDSKLYFYYVNEDGFTQNLKLEDRFDEYDAQWERMMFFREKGLDDLLGKAAMTFLKTAQWDLIVLRKSNTKPAPIQWKKFEKQYYGVWKMASKQKCINLLEHYDYYILANPQLAYFFRILRLFLKIKRMMFSG